MRWEQITTEWNKDFLGCQDLSYQSGEVGFLLATGSFNNPFARGSVKTAYRTKTRSSGCIEFLFAPFFFILYLRPCQVQLSDIFRPMCVCIQGVSEAICLGRRSLMVWYYVLLPKHQKEIDEFPFGFAFNETQFNEMMEKWNLLPRQWVIGKTGQKALWSPV